MFKAMFKIVLKTMFKTVLNPALKTLPILLLSVVNLTLVSCGTKGPLYIPEQRYPQSVPKDADKAVETDATKNAAPAANTGAPFRIRLSALALCENGDAKHW